MSLDVNVQALIKGSFVQLSTPHTCAQCGVYVRYVGEHKPNGNWYCPSCGWWISYADNHDIEIWKSAQRITDVSILFPSNGVIDN